jgi:ABC-2 type transport system permease protein
MRFVILFKKTAIENVRDWKILSMTLTFAPFFVLLMYFYFGEGTTTYRVTVIDRDEGSMGDALIARLQNVQLSDGATILRVRELDDLAGAQEQLRDRTADLVVEIPAEFSRALREHQEGFRSPPAVVKTYGDPGNVKSITAQAYADYLTYEYAATVTGYSGPLALDAQSIGRVASPSDFDLYVPALLALALMMLLFTAAASLIKEKDKGTLIRLRISNMTTVEWLSAISVAQVILGLVSMGLALLTAMVLGYRTSGSVAAILTVGALTSMAMVAISIMVAAWLRTVFDLMTIGVFPFFVLMFFSGGMFPIPDVQVFSVAGRAVNVNAILPTTHAVSALDRVLNFGAGIGDVAVELGAIASLTVAFFALGAWLFTNQHMRAT